MAKSEAKPSAETIQAVKDAVDHEKMIVDLQNEQIRSEARMDDLTNSMSELIAIVTNLNDKISVEGLPLPTEVAEILKGKEAWVWIAIVHAVVSGMFQNQVYMKHDQMPAAFEAALRSASVFQQVLINKATPAG